MLKWIYELWISLVEVVEDTIDITPVKHILLKQIFRTPLYSHILQGRPDSLC